MAIEGNPRFWRRDVKEQIPIILGLIVDSWKSFAPPTKPTIEEDSITRNFCRHLRNHKHRSIHLFNIWSQLELLSGEAIVIGKPDLIFSPLNNNEDEYFACECKLLNKTDKNGRWSSLAGKYVDEGMMRYVSEQYSGGENGGMLGYVMDGDTVKAISSVNDAIHNRKDKLCIDHKPELRKSSIRPSCQQTKETRHLLENGPFTIHHIFLPVTSCN